MDIRWELLDAATQEVLYSTTTSASSETGGQTGGSAVQVAFSRLFSSLLGSREFVAAFPTGDLAPTVAIAPVLAPTNWPTAIPAAADLIYLTEEDALPSDRSTVFERVAEGVVSILGPTGSGSGFVISRDGLALTNHHVIEGQAWLVATTRANDTLAVRLIRSDADADIALVQIMCESDCVTVQLRPCRRTSAILPRGDRAAAPYSATQLVDSSTYKALGHSRSRHPPEPSPPG